VSNTNTEFLPKAGLAYDLTDNQTVAGTATKGYRSGYAEAVIGSGTINRVAPEYLWSYEMAYRSRWLEDRLQVNANTFYYDYRDQQLVVDNPFIIGASTTQNVAKSHAYGAEIDVRWKPSRAKHRAAASRICRRRASRWASLTFGIGVPPPGAASPDLRLRDPVERRGCLVAAERRVPLERPRRPGPRRVDR